MLRSFAVRICALMLALCMVWSAAVAEEGALDALMAETLDALDEAVPDESGLTGELPAEASTDAPAATPAPFAAGYAVVSGGTRLYADASLTGASDTLAAPATVYALACRDSAVQILLAHGGAVQSAWVREDRLSMLDADAADAYVAVARSSAEAVTGKGAVLLPVQFAEDTTPVPTEAPAADVSVEEPTVVYIESDPIPEAETPAETDEPAVPEGSGQLDEIADEPTDTEDVAVDEQTEVCYDDVLETPDTTPTCTPAPAPTAAPTAAPALVEEQPAASSTPAGSTGVLTQQPTPDPAPRQVTGVHAWPTGVSAVRIAWDAQDGDQGYQVFRSLDRNGPYTWLKNVSAPEAANLGLTPGTAYWYQVRAWQDGEAGRTYGAFSAPVCAVTMGPITGLHVYGQDTNAALIVWDRAEGVTGYQLFRREAGTEDFVWVKNATTAQVANYVLTPGASYEYRVRSYHDNPDGSRAYGPFTAPASVTIQEISAISSRTATPAGSYTLTWNEQQAPVTGYQVFMSPGNNEYTWVCNTTQASLTMTRRLTPGHRYYFKVRSYIDQENGRRAYGQYSAGVGLNVPLEAPCRGHLYDQAAIMNNAVRLSGWVEPLPDSALTGLVVRLAGGRTLLDVNVSGTARIDLSADAYRLPAMTETGTYTLELLARDAFGETWPLGQAELIVCRANKYYLYKMPAPNDLPPDSPQTRRDSFLRVVRSQLGYEQDPGIYTKYGAFMKIDGNPWCASFVSWCARMAGVPDTVIRSNTYARPDNLVPNGTYYYFRTAARMPAHSVRVQRGEFAPQTGDLFFFGPAWAADYAHVGVVISCDGTTVTAIDGNGKNAAGKSDPTVQYRTFAIDDPRLVGFARPPWNQ